MERRGRPLTTPASVGTGNLAARAATAVDTAASVGESKVGRTFGAVVGNEQAKTFGTAAARIGGSAVRIAAKALSGPVGIALEVGFFLFSGRKIQVRNIRSGIKEELRDLHDNLPDNIFMKGTPQKFYTIMSKRVQDTFDTLVDYYTNLYKSHNYPKENISKWIGDDKKQVDMRHTRPTYWKRITEAYVGSRGIRGLAEIAKAKGSPLAAFLEEYLLATIDTRNATSEPGVVTDVLNWMQSMWGSDSKDKNHKEKFLKKLKAIKPVTVFDWLAMKHVEREIMSKTGSVEYQAPVTASGETIHVGGTSTARLGKGFAINATKASATASRSPHGDMSVDMSASSTAAPSIASVSPHSMDEMTSKTPTLFEISQNPELAKSLSEEQLNRIIDEAHVDHLSMQSPEFRARLVKEELEKREMEAVQSVPSTDPSIQSAASTKMAEQSKESLQKRAKSRYMERKLKEHQELARKHEEAEKQKQLEAQIDTEYAAFSGMGGMTVEPEMMPVAGSSSSREPSLSDFGIPMSTTEAVQSAETQMTAAATKSRQDKATDEIADKIAAKIAPRIAVAASGTSRRQGRSGGAAT